MIEHTKQAVRSVMRLVARLLNTVTRGKVTPDGVTLFGLAMHIPIAFLIAAGHDIWAATFLVVFGLFDTLDGELARLQHRVSLQGRLLDSVTDRMKEIMLYTGLAYGLMTHTTHPYLAAWAVAACGCSLLTSYVNAAGDAIIVAQKQSTEHAANKAFRSGFMPFEIRMVVLVIGLLSSLVPLAVIVIALGAGLTAIGRLFRVMRSIKEANG